MIIGDNLSTETLCPEEAARRNIVGKTTNAESNWLPYNICQIQSPNVMMHKILVSRKERQELIRPADKPFEDRNGAAMSQYGS